MRSINLVYSAFIKIAFSCFCIFQIGNIYAHVNLIKNEDREAIEELFQTLICNDQFGYTIFGDKPVSLSGGFIITPWENRFRELNNGEKGNFWSNWSTWKKYETSMKFKNYILTEEMSLKIDDIKFIIIINKKAFIDCVNRNKEIFDSELGYKCEADQLIESIACKTKNFQQAINNSELLWGLLLGYGVQNSQLFNRREEISRISNTISLLKKCITPSQSFRTIESEEACINEKLNCLVCGVDYPFMKPYIRPVQFVADIESEESKSLKTKYSKIQSKILRIYQAGEFSKITLNYLSNQYKNQ